MKRFICPFFCYRRNQSRIETVNSPSPIHGGRLRFLRNSGEQSSSARKYSAITHGCGAGRRRTGTSSDCAADAIS